MRHLRPRRNSLLLRLTTLLLCACAFPAGAALAQGYEVWMVDQNNTAGFSAAAPRGTHGGRLLIYDSADLDNPSGPVSNPFVIDLAQIFVIGGPHNNTGANVVRPHMAVPSPDGRRFMALAFVASGHVAIFDGATKQPKALFRMSVGAGGARQAHAAFWTPDGGALIVANQNGKLLERIRYDGATDTFVHDTAATLNLATCTTPNGNPCQTNTPLNDTDPAYLGPHNRPDNAPICPVMSRRGHAFVTLRGGGLFVVDARATPMAIVAEYGNQMVGRDGCGGVQNGVDIFLNGGTGTLATNPTEFTLYQFKDLYPFAPSYLTPNYMGFCLGFLGGRFPQAFYRNNSPDRDAHGMVKTSNSRYIWQFDRIANVAEVFRLPPSRRTDSCPPYWERGTPQHVRTVNLITPGVSDDPTPDLGAVSPTGHRIYIALRGPQPQTGAHAAVGSTPGLGIVSVTQDGQNGSLTHVLRTSFLSPVNGSEESDPHAAFLRLK
jgi:hypothetical protein